MMRVPIKWWLLGGGLLLTLWLVWHAPDTPDNQTIVVSAVQPVTRSATAKVEKRETSSQSQILLSRQSPEMVSNLFRTPPRPVVAVVKPPETSILPPPTALPALPFRHIGSMEKDASVTVFIMEGQALHLLQAGDSPRADYLLETIDLSAGELRWRHIPSQKILNMSIQP